MIKTSPAALQVVQEALLTLNKDCEVPNTKKKSHLTLPGVQLKSHYTTVAEHSPGPDFCKGQITL